MKLIKIIAIFVVMILMLDCLVELSSLKSPLAWVALFAFPFVIGGAVTLGIRVYVPRKPKTQ